MASQRADHPPPDEAATAALIGPQAPVDDGDDVYAYETRELMHILNDAEDVLRQGARPPYASHAVVDRTCATAECTQTHGRRLAGKKGGLACWSLPLTATRRLPALPAPVPAAHTGELHELSRTLGLLEEVLHHLAAGNLTPDQTHVVTYNSMPKLVLMVLKLPVPNQATCDRLEAFLHTVLRLTVDMLRHSPHWELIECSTRILSDQAAFPLYNIPARGGGGGGGGRGRSPLGDGESASSGEGSGSDVEVDSSDNVDGSSLDGNILSTSARLDDFSPYYVRNIEYFHSQGGFHAVLERVGREPRVNFNAVRLLLRPFAKIKDLLSRHALQTFMRQAYGVVMRSLKAITDEQLKQEDRKSIADLTKQLDQLLQCAKLQNASRAVDDFSLALALKCLRAPNLEKRLSGLSEIKELIAVSVRKDEYMEDVRERVRQGQQPPPPPPLPWTTPDLLVQWVRKMQVVELIFGEGLHDQVVRRCVDVLVFLAMRGALDERVLDMVWRASLDKHESVKQAIYTVLIDLTGHLQPHLLDALYAHIQSVPHADYTSHTLILLRGFAVSALQSVHNPLKARRWYGLEEFWQLMQQTSPVSPDLRQMAASFLSDLLGWQQCYPQRAQYLERCVAQLRQGTSVPQALRLCQRVAMSFPMKPRKKSDSLQSVLEWLDATHDLLAVFFEDFARYHAAATQRLAHLAASVSADEADSAADAALGAARTEHMAQVSDRLDFLDFCAKGAPLPLSQPQLDVLWDCCVDRASSPIEADNFFRWLEKCRTQAHALDAQTTRHIFTRASELRLESISPTGFACIELLFKWVNWKENRFVQREGAFSVLDLPLYGAQTLWEVALRATDETVGRRAVGLLTQLHHSLDPSLGNALPQQRRAFVALCMQSLAAAAAQLRRLQPLGAEGAPSEGAPSEGAPSGDDQLPDAPPIEDPSSAGDGTSAAPASIASLSLRVTRCLTLLRLYVEEVEAKLPADDSSLRARRHGTAVRGTPMRITVTLVGGSNTPKFEVRIDSNQNVGTLRARVWQQLGSHDEWQPEAPKMLRMITQGRELKEEWKSLGELRLREPFGIHVMRRQQTSATQPRATVAGGAAAAGAGSSSCERADDDGEDERHGGGGDAPMDGENESGEGELDESCSPGQMLADEGSHFSTLFELLTLRDESLSTQAWQLLMMLPTNRAMRSGLASLSALTSAQPADWASLLHVGPSSFKLLYSLQIVDCLMLGEHVVNESATSAGPEASPWCSAFVAHGGLSQLLAILMPADESQELLDPRRGSQRKQCLVLLLRLLCQFLLARPSPAADGLPIAPPEPAELVAFAPHPRADGSMPITPPPAAPFWVRRAFSPLSAGELTTQARTPAFARRLMTLLEKAACGEATPADEQSGGVGSGGKVTLTLERPAVEGSQDALDMAISRETCQLLVGCWLSEPQLCASMLSDSTRLHEWLHGILLRCPNVEVRLELINALYTLSGGSPPSPPPSAAVPADGRGEADGSAMVVESESPVVMEPASAPLVPLATDARAVRSALAEALLQQLPCVEGANARSRQYFELVQALLHTEERAELGGSGEPSCPSSAESLGRLIARDGAVRLRTVAERLVAMLAEHGVHERRDRPEMVDQVLLGLLHTLRLLHKYLPTPARQQLLQGVFEALFELPGLSEARMLGPGAPPKCKTIDTRVAGLGLLAELAEHPGNADVRAELLELLLKLQEERGGAGAPRTLWHYMPSAMERARCGYVGLKNLGATCYLNALAQQLYMIPEFRQGIIELPVPDGPLVPPEKGSSEPNRAFLAQLQHMFGYLHESQKRFFDTRDLCSAWRDYEQLPINPSIQMDVDEFYNMLFEQLEQGLRDTPAKKLLQGLFGGTTVSQIVSKDPSKPGLLSERQELFYTISIEVKCKKSILDGLAAYVEGEVLDGDNKYKCDSGEYVEAVKRTCIDRLPPVLILHLKRFEFDFEAMKKVKLDDNFEFPQTINMRPYTVDTLSPAGVSPVAPVGTDAAATAGASSDGPASPIPAVSGGDVAGGDVDSDDAGAGPSSAADDAAALAAGQLYELVGVLVHSGTADSGHYYSYIKERRTDPVARQASGSSWLHFNDTLVEPFDERDIAKACYGGPEPIVQWDAELQKHVQRMAPKPHSAYMLFYERVHPPEKPTTPAAESAAVAAAAEAKAAAERRRKTDPEYDEARGAAVMLSEPRAACVPEPIVRSAWEENMQFLRDRLVFDPPHFAFVRRIVDGAVPLPGNDVADGTAAHGATAGATPPVPPTGAVDGDALSAGDGGEHALAMPEPVSLQQLNENNAQTMCALRLGCRFLVETLAHAKDKQSLPAWSALLQSGLHGYLPACRWLLLEAEAAGWLRQMLLICTVAEMRNAFSTLLLHAMACLRPSELPLYAMSEPPVAIDVPMQGVALVDSSDSSSSASDDESDTGGALPRNAMDVEGSGGLVGATMPLPLDTIGGSRPGNRRREDAPSAPEGGGGTVAIGPQLPPGSANNPKPGPKSVRLASSAAVRVIDSLLTMVHEAPSHWRHFPQFFLVLLEFARMGSAERELMLRRRVVTLLIDFYLGDESPLAADDGPHHRPKRTRMGDKYTLPNLEHMVDLIANLVLSSARVDSRPEAPTLSESTPYSIEPLLTMAPTEQQLATCAPFVSKLLKEGLNVRALEALLLHASYDAQERSVQLLQIVLHGIDTMDSDALQPYLHCFVSMVTLQDAHREWRIHAAMTKLLRVIANNMRFKLATIACLRMLISLATHTPTRRWLLAHHMHWVQDWLLGGMSEGVRQAAEQLIVALLAAEAAETAEAAGAPVTRPPTLDEAVDAGADGAGGEGTAGEAAPPLAAPLERFAWTCSVYDHLLGLLPLATDYAKELGPEPRDGQGGQRMAQDDVAPTRLAAYFRVLTWCARNGGIPSVPIMPLAVCYDVQDGHHWECDEAKKQLVLFWHVAALAPQPQSAQSSALALAANPNTFRRLLDSFVSLRPQERHMRYNRELLPPFYGLLHAAMSYEPNRKQCLHTLATHRNWEWAIKYVLTESSDYANLLAAQRSVQAQPLGPPQENTPLSFTLLALLEPCASAFSMFRQKILSHMLEEERTNFGSSNVLALLELLVTESEDKALVADHRTLHALTSIAEAAYSRATEHGNWDALEAILKIISRVAEFIAKLPREQNARKLRALQVWGIGADPQRAMPLLNVLFALLAPVLGRVPETAAAAAVQQIGPQIGPQMAPAGPQTPPPSMRALSFELATQLAVCDAHCARTVLVTLLQHHDTATAVPVHDDSMHSVQTLAGLQSPHPAVVVAQLHGEQLVPYYEFAVGLLYAALNGHLHDSGVLTMAMRLALLLTVRHPTMPRVSTCCCLPAAPPPPRPRPHCGGVCVPWTQAETSVLPSACERFTRLVKQAAALVSTNHTIGVHLALELKASGHALLTHMLLHYPLGLITVVHMVEMATELLRVVPPGEEWITLALEAQASALAVISQDPADHNDALHKAMGTATLLLQQAAHPAPAAAQQPAPAEQPPAAAEGAAAHEEVEAVADDEAAAAAAADEP